MLRCQQSLEEGETKELFNLLAAESLAEEFVKTADSLCTFPYAHKAYIPIRPLIHEYRKVSVKNHLIFFRAEKETRVVTITRVIYAARYDGKLLKQHLSLALQEKTRTQKDAAGYLFWMFAISKPDVHLP